MHCILTSRQLYSTVHWIIHKTAKFSQVDTTKDDARLSAWFVVKVIDLVVPDMDSSL